MLRQIHDVIGTYDARHVLALCTDGGVMYYKRDEVDETAELMELNLQRDVDFDQVWAVKRVGSLGDVVLLRVAKASDGTDRCAIHVNLLSGKINK